MVEAAQAMSELLLKPYSFETKKHGERRGRIKKHSPSQAQLLLKLGIRSGNVPLACVQLSASKICPCNVLG